MAIRAPDGANKLTNLNIFSGLLSLPVLQRRTKGDKVCLGEGDYMAWSEMQWDLRGGAKSEMIRPEELKTRPMVNLYSARFPIKDCQRFCKHLGTQMTSVSNTQKLERLLIFCDEKMKDISDSQWLAVDDIDEEGVWKDSFTGQPLNYTPPWMDGQPNGGRGENCAILSGCSWFDSPCNNDLYCLCENTPRPILKLLGLCKDTLIDRVYQTQNDVKDIERLTIVGQSTKIEYDQNRMLWLMSVVHLNVTGTSVATHTSFTLGKNEWTIVGDTGCNKKSNSYEIYLKMSGCGEKDFTCYDGECVSMNERCDQVPNCRDHSDEIGCQILVLEEGYNKRVPPVGKHEEKMGEIREALKKIGKIYKKNPK